MLDSPVSSDPAILDSPIIDILPLPEQVPTSYSANQQGFAECEIHSPNPSEGDSAVCLDKREGPDSRTVSKDKQTLFPDNPSIPEDPTLPYVLPDSRLEHCEHLGCMKSTIPLSKLKGLQDELDIPEVVEFKCSDCVNCPTCKLSARAKTKSLQESFEQEAIEKSVHVNIENQCVWVDLPFVKEPVEFLSRKHGASDNKRQALRVYQAQCSNRKT